MADYNHDSDSRKIEPNTIYIGEGVNVSGDVVVPQVVVVDGSIEGNVTARAVWVGPSGVIKGKIIATEAEIYGSVSEMIEGKQLLCVRSTGRVSGNVSYGELLLEKGAVISGSFSSTNFQPDAKQPAPEQILGSSERPMIVHRIESGRPLNGNSNGSGVAASANGQTKLPPADYREAV